MLVRYVLAQFLDTLSSNVRFATWNLENTCMFSKLLKFVEECQSSISDPKVPRFDEISSTLLYFLLNQIPYFISLPTLFFHPRNNVTINTRVVDEIWRTYNAVVNPPCNFASIMSRFIIRQLLDEVGVGLSKCKKINLSSWWKNRKTNIRKWTEQGCCELAR